MCAAKQPAWQQLVAVGDGATNHETSEEWLLRCLKRNADTVYGRKYDFAKLGSLEDYQKKVPLCVYDDLAELIGLMAAGEPDILFAGKPAAFEQTSGSSGPAKLIPYSAESLRDFQHALLPWVGSLVKEYSLQGSLYWSISPALRESKQTSGEIPVGLGDADYLGLQAAQAVAVLTAVPFAVGQVPELSSWRLLTIYHLLRAHDLCFVSLWSPTFFTVLLDALVECAEDLLALLRHGGAVAGQRLGIDQAAAIRLESYLGSADTRLLWPSLTLVSAWGDAGANASYNALQKRLPQAHFQRKGLLSTEGVVTVPNHQGKTFVPFGCGLVEFLKADGKCVFADSLQAGASYQVVLSTSGGLYRYITGDMVVCEKFQGKDLHLRFCGRTGLVSDLVGEKLSEYFVESILQGLEGFRMLVPYNHMGSGYSIVLEQGRLGAEKLAEQVEKALLKNPQYAYARKLGQLVSLQPLEIIAAEKKYFLWAGHCGKGPLGSRKIPSLVLDTDWINAG